MKNKDAFTYKSRFIRPFRNGLSVATSFFKDKPVKRAWLFGSYARGDANEDSDVDLLVELDHSTTIGWNYYVWFDQLSEEFEKKVDIVSVGWENKRIRPFIDNDKHIIYEK